MASFTGVGDTVTLKVPARGENIDIDISGTYDMTIEFQREQGSPGSGSWQVLKTFNTEDATEFFQHLTLHDNESLRLILTVDGGGTATVTLADNDNRSVRTVRDFDGSVLTEVKQLADINSGAAINRPPDGTPNLTKIPAPSTATTATDMTEAELLGGMHVKSPTAAQNLQVPTGTEISAALLLVQPDFAIGDSFDFTLINTGTATDIVTLTVDTDVTFVGYMGVHPAADGATLGISVGVFRFRNTAANTWIAYRVG